MYPIFGLDGIIYILPPCSGKIIPQGMSKMEESLCTVEFLKSANTYLARVQSDLGGLREYKGSVLEDVLEQVIIDLQEEFESSGI